MQILCCGSNSGRIDACSVSDHCISDRGPYAAHPNFQELYVTFRGESLTLPRIRSSSSSNAICWSGSSKMGTPSALSCRTWLVMWRTVFRTERVEAMSKARSSEDGLRGDPVPDQGRERTKNSPRWSRKEKVLLDDTSGCFRSENLSNLTKEDFLGFLLIKNNRHWDGIHRFSCYGGTDHEGSPWTEPSARALLAHLHGRVCALLHKRLDRDLPPVVCSGRGRIKGFWDFR